MRNLAFLLVASAVIAGVIGFLTLDRPGLPALYPMPSFELTGQDGKAFSSKALEGKVVVANFVFTSCPTVCPTLTAKMAELQKALAKEEQVHLMSFSVDPKNDTPEVLKAYGEKFGQDPSRWTFVTGDLAEVMKAVELGFRIGVTGADDPEATAFDIVHGEHFVLVDAKGMIRGYYAPTPEALARLAEDARTVAAE
ncbi:SCO family protein [Vulgatibacter incomptus]|uniref:Cytochrome oxidase biogenesis protein Sco1/SenC/PrrC, putative copper metallochaperone n=1 Tax=Vulgatibacter incomptus TaxID=1391653 RepID=A0A0K1PBY9_9BACT|nr:SCO family protein [Vulgatibacter incomptus]AKU91053.1 Cytochrome oxidase biogenesis protein Sco1/SenC/PrrC, putative copper metallochaperone [Vulgatibacter incomptus]